MMTVLLIIIGALLYGAAQAVAFFILCRYSRLFRLAICKFYYLVEGEVVEEHEIKEAMDEFYSLLFNR